MESHRLYHSLNIVRVIKSRRLRWAGRVARMEEEGRSGLEISTGKGLLVRPRRRWKVNIRKGLSVS